LGSAARRRRRTVLGLMSPWLIGMAVFFVYPLVATVYLSFQHYDLLSPPRWVGLANFRYMTQDVNFWPSVQNSIWLILVSVPCSTVFAFWVAHLLSRVRRGAGVLRTLFYLPTLAPPVAATLGFLYLLNGSTGPVDRILGALHLPQPLWFDDPHWAKPSLVLLGMWGTGSVMIIFLAALLDVPVELYEAAELDGVGPWQRMRYVTLPTVSPVILFAVITAVIDGLQYFTQGFVAGTVAGGGDAGAGTGSSLGYPQGSTLFYPVWLYQQGFQYFAMGYASAMAVVLFVVALAVTGALLVASRRYIYVPGAR
jgi:multiple sugar transport system permease protein